MTTTLMVASAGGHLAELFRLRPRLPDKDARTVWLAADHPHTRSVLRDSHAFFVPGTASRDLVGTLRNVRLTRRILDEVKPDWIVSNGASLAVSTFLNAALRGIPCTYLENSVRVEGPSLSAKLCSWLPGVGLYTQYPSQVHGRWRLMGSVLDQWQALPGPAARPIRKVVVTVGTMSWPFRRLFERLVSVLPAEAEVIWQSGCNDLSDLGLEGVASLPAEDLDRAMHEADLVIAHAGIGSAMSAFDAGKMPILAPRLMHTGEAVDDHQTHIGRELAARGLCRFVEADAITLEDLLFAASMSVSERPNVPDILRPDQIPQRGAPVRP